MSDSHRPSDFDPSPPDGGDAPNGYGVPDDPKLIAEGWVRRHLVDPARAKESTELYTSMGLEVMVRKLAPSDFGAKCQSCAESICATYVIIYTRKKPSE